MLSCPVEDVFFGGSRGGGKSDAAIGKSVAHAHWYGQHARILLLRRTLPELDEIKARCRELLIPLGCVFSKSENTWTFPNGASMKLRYLESDEDATRYQGHQYTLIIVDEAGAFRKPDPIDMLRGTLRSAAGVPCSLLLTGNPGGRGHAWLKERYIDPAGPLTPFVDPVSGIQRVFIPSRLTDNQALLKNDPGYVRRLRASGPSWLVKAWLDGDWSIAVDGKIFLREWWKYYSTLPADRMHIVQSWDIAAKDKEQNDYSVCTTWAIYPHGFYLLDVWRDKLTFPDLKRQVVALAEKWKCYEVMVEDTSSGTAIVQELKRESRLALRPITPKGSKYERALAVTALIESGRVFIPETAPWLSDFLDELSGFPGAPHDDTVDSVSQALKRLADTYTFGESQGFDYTPVRKASPRSVEPSFGRAEDDETPTDWRSSAGTM